MFLTSHLKCLIFLSLSLAQVLKNVSWYTERTLTEISLGSLLILVVIRTIQFNMTRTRVSLTHIQTYSLCTCKVNRYAFRTQIVINHIHIRRLKYRVIYSLTVTSGNMSVCVCILPRINTSTPTVLLHLPTCQPSFVVSTSMLPSVSSGEDILEVYNRPEDDRKC